MSCWYGLIRLTVPALLLGFSATVIASQTSPLYGEWGDSSQCARELITPEGTKHYTPFDIQHDWLGYGGLWCRLIWSTVQTTSTGMYAVASARCGEDTVRDYQIKFDLHDSRLTLRWNDELENGPLARCAP